MKNIELYNKVMSGLSNVVRQHLNESMRKITYAQYCETYDIEDRYEIEKMIVRTDLINPKYLEEYTYFDKRYNRECPQFLIRFDKMTENEASLVLSNINWTHPLAFIDINEYDKSSVDIIVPGTEDISLFIEYDVSFNYYPGSAGSYWEPPSSDEVEINDFTINDAYLEIYSGNKTTKKIKLDLDVKNHEGHSLRDVLYDICQYATDLQNMLCESYEGNDYDDGGLYYDD